MSGHSKWSTIKHKKGAADAKRSKIFTKIAREIVVAAKLGGEDADSNPRLRSAMVLARSQNMPNENIKRAIIKGAGGGKGEDYHSITYEGYGPHQATAIVECLTDNKNRTISNIRTIFNKSGGAIGSTNSVMYAFDHMGAIEVKKESIDEDSLTEHILEGGAEDIDTSPEEIYYITTAADELHQVATYLEKQGVEIESTKLVYIAQNKMEITDLSQAQSVLRFIDALEDDDDVQNVHSNFDLSDEVIAQLEAEG
ncbi:MAG: YebC/PmpR family DNA-binding transcriptional regulator [SAR324 cluster bacterium]|nr:YebC/PmpR family DNA-binding transcriptional regulator [SAR324 cluster bacterium]